MELMHKHGKQFCSWNRLEMLSIAFFFFIKQTYIETAEISIYISMQSSKNRGKRNYIYYQQSDAMSVLGETYPSLIPLEFLYRLILMNHLQISTIFLWYFEKGVQTKFFLWWRPYKIFRWIFLRALHEISILKSTKISIIWKRIKNVDYSTNFKSSIR